MTTRNAGSSDPLLDETQTVVVGGGSAGAAVAGLLAEAGRPVLLLEAGADYGPFEAGAWPPDILDARALSSSHEWGFSSETTYSNRVVAFQRARVLGGCSSHNGCAAIWGHRADYDAWAEAGNPGWATDELVPLFREAEARLRVRHDRRSQLTPFHEHCVQAAEAAGISFTDDLNNLDENEGLGLAPVNIVEGIRWNSAFAFLDPVRDGDALSIISNVLVDRVMIHSECATGVVVVTSDGPHEIRAERTVLAAGTYCTPAILQRSGIGSEDVLSRAGLRTTHRLPGVGANLHDHPAMVIGYSGTPELQAQLETYEGWLAEEQTIAKLRSPSCSRAFDLHLYPMGGPHPERPGEWRWELPVSCMTPRSRGTVAVRGADPSERPLIDHGYLTDPEGHDEAVLTEGVRIAREIASRKPLATLLGEEIRPRGNPEDLAQAIQDSVEHYYHPVGTCQMGPAADPKTVVDSDGRVHGVDGLLVADCSIVPTAPRANTHLPATVIGLRMARALLDESPPAELTRPRADGAGG